MNLGVVLPTFRRSTDDALEVAARCAELGIDGVFAYDHLWPLGSPERPSFAPFPVLARVGRLFPTVKVGTLVARVGMMSSGQIAERFIRLNDITPGNVICGIGTGDSASRDELNAYGLPFFAPESRREMIREVVTFLEGSISLFLGGTSAPIRALAAELGAEVNCWNMTVGETAAVAATSRVNWAGPVPFVEGDDSAKAMHQHLDAMANAGASWVIYTPGVNIDHLSQWTRGAMR
jgi:alkanesulfonate monooxygenase SsuD/methylene tetrahydromethanopterin reductase-like flavin-dependent oxidoreductase (luciferase family)